MPTVVFYLSARVTSISLTSQALISPQQALNIDETI